MPGLRWIKNPFYLSFAMPYRNMANSYFCPLRRREGIQPAGFGASGAGEEFRPPVLVPEFPGRNSDRRFWCRNFRGGIQTADFVAANLREEIQTTDLLAAGSREEIQTANLLAAGLREGIQPASFGASGAGKEFSPPVLLPAALGRDSDR